MMYIEDIGEIDFIQWIKERAGTNSRLVCGIGDDCAVVNSPIKGLRLLYTTDNLIENVHFSKDNAFDDIGKKSLARSLSDIAAMGGIPRFALLSLAIPQHTQMSRLEAFVTGFIKMASHFEVSLIGGDLSRSTSQFYINVTVIGEIEEDCVVYRSGVKVNDKIYVTGSLGGSQYAKHLHFEPRVNEARWLVKKHIPNAMIDVSDGLEADLMRILRQNDVGAVIWENALPSADVIKLKKGLLDHMLYDGEDYELLFLTNVKDKGWVEQFKKKFNVSMSCIGEIVQGERLMIERFNGERNEVTQRGFKHF